MLLVNIKKVNILKKRHYHIAFIYLKKIIWKTSKLKHSVSRLKEHITCIPTKKTYKHLKESAENR